MPSKTPQKAETSEGSVDVGAAVVLNIVTSINRAYIPETLNITSGGTLTLEASGNTDSEAKADGSAVKKDPDNPTKVGVGVAVAINVVTIVNQAYIAQGAIVEARGLTIKVGMTRVTGPDAEGNPTTDDTNTHVVEAISGAGAASVGVAGSATINVVVNTVLAHSDGSVTLSYTDESGDTQYGNAEISAESKNESTTSAGAVVNIEGEGDNQKASVGVGAAFATNVVTNIVRAYLADNASLTGAGKLTISAELENTAQTTATAGSDPIEDFTGDEKASESKIALDAAVALTIVVNEVKAYSGTGSTIGANGNVIISSASTSNTETTAEGNASGSKVAVGACLALNVIVANTEAALKGNATIGGSLTVSASSTNRDDVFALATARGLSLDRYLNKFKDALNNLSVDDILNGNFGKDENGNDKPKPKSAEALEQYDAKTGQTVDQNGGSGQGSQSQQSICVAAAIAINVTTHDTIAYTGGGTISVGGNIVISATSQSDFETLATGIAVGEGNSIGVAVALSTIFNETSAALGLGSTAGSSSTNANGHDITIQAISSQNRSDEYRSKLGSQAIAGAGTGKDGKIGAAGALAIVTSFAKTQAYIAPQCPSYGCRYHQHYSRRNQQIGCKSLGIFSRYRKSRSRGSICHYLWQQPDSRLYWQGSHSICPRAEYQRREKARRSDGL
ncbi:MAG: hypothetical protein ACOX3R_02285 [Desulfitobacteriia bacterium]